MTRVFVSRLDPVIRFGDETLVLFLQEVAGTTVVVQNMLLDNL